MSYVIILSMLSFLFKPLANLSLRTTHLFGLILGQCIFICSGKFKSLITNNLKQSCLISDKALLSKAVAINARETGKFLLETLTIWQKSEGEILAFVKNVHGWQHIEAALSAQKGLIFLTPHMGCFEITSIFYGSKNPITVLYRPPKQKWLLSMMKAGRNRTGVTLAEANAGGVRKLMQALKRNEAIGILPDQIPAKGEGEWANFFGKPAYTMTLACKLAEKTGAAVIMAFGERLANGAGFDIYLTTLNSIATPSLLNTAIERQIAQNPYQYLWQYDRWKLRRHAVKY